MIMLYIVNMKTHTQTDNEMGGLPPPTLNVDLELLEAAISTAPAVISHNTETLCRKTLTHTRTHPCFFPLVGRDIN